MKKKLITYGVFGMMEYQAVVKVCGRNTPILFSDGSMTAMGVNPARYTTDSIMLQIAIEQCPQYKRGIIQKVSETELDEEIKIASNAPAKPEEDAPQEPDAEVKEFDSLDDARDFLATAHDVPRSNLKKRSDIEAAGASFGYKIVIA